MKYTVRPLTPNAARREERHEVEADTPVAAADKLLESEHHEGRVTFSFERRGIHYCLTSAGWTLLVFPPEVSCR